MRNGGYKIIDLKGVDVKSGATIEGVYAAVKETLKPIVLAGLNINGTEYKDLFVNFIASGSNYVGKVDTITITITNADLITGTIA